MNYDETIRRETGELAATLDVLAAVPVADRDRVKYMFAEKYANFLDLEEMFIYPELSAATVTTLRGQVATIKPLLVTLMATPAGDAGFGAAVTAVDTALATHITSINDTAVPEATTRSGKGKLDWTNSNYITADSVR